jgi:predicted dienelactone hydrolase
VWFPSTDDSSEPTLATRGVPFPLIVMSHGASGAPLNYAWLAEDLARSGVVVLGVAHFGDSWMYGTDTIDGVTVARLWVRPSDCSFALTQLLESQAFKDRIDTARIGALGHSSGGAAAIALGGAVFDPGALVDYCRSDAGELDRGCWYARAVTVPAVFPPEATRNYRDSRVVAIVALDPAAGPACTAEALADVRVPVMVVGSEDNDFLPFERHAGHYGRLLPNVSVVVLRHGEGHFVYLNTAIDSKEALGVPLYVDRQGVNRDAVHARLAPEILAFFLAAMEVSACEEDEGLSFPR